MGGEEEARRDGGEGEGERQKERQKSLPQQKENGKCATCKRKAVTLLRAEVVPQH